DRRDQCRNREHHRHGRGRPAAVLVVADAAGAFRALIVRQSGLDHVAQTEQAEGGDQQREDGSRDEPRGHPRSGIRPGGAGCKHSSLRPRSISRSASARPSAIVASSRLDVRRGGPMMLRRARWWLVGSGAALAPAAALGQERVPDWGWGMHPMWWMWGAGGMVMLLFWGMVIAGLVVGIRWLVTQGRASGPDFAMQILRERYARGDIGREEFEAKRRDLGP